MSEDLRATLKAVLCTGETLEQFCARIDKDLDTGEIKHRDAYLVLRHVMTGLIHYVEKGNPLPPDQRSPAQRHQQVDEENHGD